MNRLAISIIALAGMFGATAAMASSPDAWDAHAKEVKDACLKASGFKDPKPVGKIATFPDDVGYDVVLVRGKYPQAHMKGQTGRAYCLFERKSRKASTTEADLPRMR